MLKVFLVEDEAIIREGLRDIIPWQQYGFLFSGEAADGRERPGTPLFVEKEFEWAGRCWRIPAVYLCGKGLAVDFCVRIPAEEIRAFLKKWNEERRIQAYKGSGEELEEMERVNPTVMDFRVEARINGQDAGAGRMCSVGWYPAKLEEEETDSAVSAFFAEEAASAESGFFAEEAASAVSEPSTEEAGGVAEDAPSSEYPNCMEAEELMAAYGCDRNFAWYFARAVFSWKTRKKPVLRQLMFTLSKNPVPVSGEHFRTKEGNEPRDISFTHPASGKEYILHLDSCKSGVLPEGFFPESDKWIYPREYLAMAYIVSPELPQGEFQLQDCGEGDRPIRREARKEDSRLACGASAVFLAGKGAISALHFEPVQEVEWRMVFYVNETEEKTVRII